MSKNTRTRIILTAVAALLLVVMTVGGTLAYLADSSDKVTNTFTESEMDVTITESDADGDGNLLENEYKMVPGHTITKNPTVTVSASSEAAYVFVRIEEKIGTVTLANGTTCTFADFLSWEIADGWTALDSATDNGVYVYYRNTSEGNQSPYQVLKNDAVLVDVDVNKEMMDKLTADNYPQLVIDAYSVQYYASNNTPMDVDDAWALTGN